MFRIVHHYLTVGKNDEILADYEEVDVPTWDEVPDTIRTMMDFPGGKSGTTISLVVSRTAPVSLWVP